MASAALAPVADALLISALSTGERLVARATTPGVALALDQLGDIDIPEPVATRIDKAQLRALATLYLAADLEPAGVVPSVEALAGIASTGAVPLDLGAAQPLLAEWWRQRHDRVSASERRAFFSRLFGTSSGPVAADAERNVHFEDRMLDLCEALYKLDEIPTGDPYGGTLQQARVRRAAGGLIQNLGQAGGGITAFLAVEITTELRQAFTIISHPDVRATFAARDVWDVVAAVARIARAPFTAPAPHVRRGRAGMTVIAWLADVSDRLAGPGGPLVAIGHPVVGSAIDWIEATLDIGEAMAPAARPGLPSGASPWSVVGA